MSIFNRNNSENGNYSSSSSTSEQWHSDQLDSQNVDDNEDYEYGIEFQEELSNGAIIFLIVDDDYEHSGGYVVVSPSGIPTVIIDDLYEINDIDKKHVESLAKTFFEATRK